VARNEAVIPEQAQRIINLYRVVARKLSSLTLCAQLVCGYELNIMSRLPVMGVDGTSIVRGLSALGAAFALLNPLAVPCVYCHGLAPCFDDFAPQLLPVCGVGDALQLHKAIAVPRTSARARKTGQLRRAWRQGIDWCVDRPDGVQNPGGPFDPVPEAED
jgi:hypothetical protein